MLRAAHGRLCSLVGPRCHSWSSSALGFPRTWTSSRWRSFASACSSFDGSQVRCFAPFSSSAFRASACTAVRPGCTVFVFPLSCRRRYSSLAFERHPERARRTEYIDQFTVSVTHVPFCVASPFRMSHFVLLLPHLRSPLLVPSLHRTRILNSVLIFDLSFCLPFFLLSISPFFLLFHFFSMRSFIERNVCSSHPRCP